MSKEENLYNEQKLISACINNDPSAQKLLFETYASSMLSVCARYCPNMEDAKDAMHEGFIKIFQQIDKFQGNSKLKTWMTRLMIYTAIDHFRQSIKFAHYENDEEVYAAASTSYADDVVEYDDEKIDIKELYAAINALPQGYKTIFNMYAIDGFSHKQIAEKLKISDGTSKSQLARARKQLQDILKTRLTID
jgi:RNA polymerase sigma factor (sigma-70 family)